MSEPRCQFCGERLEIHKSANLDHAFMSHDCGVTVQCTGRKVDVKRLLSRNALARNTAVESVLLALTPTISLCGSEIRIACETDDEARELLDALMPHTASPGACSAEPGSVPGSGERDERR